MEFAIIAAGEGSRLISEGMNVPKPLVMVQQKRLIERLIDTFLANDATRIHVIINEYSEEVNAFLHQMDPVAPLNVIRKTTPSSLHSFHEVISRIEGESVCLTTVDTIFDPVEFSNYLRAFKQDAHCDGLMAVTSFIDDESPLYIALNDCMGITQYLDEREFGVNFVSGGIYCLKRSVFGVVNEAVETGVHRMRNFQRMLIKKGFNIKAHVFSKIIDIDHVSDIALAEDWLNTRPGMVLSNV